MKRIDRGGRVLGWRTFWVPEERTMSADRVPVLGGWKDLGARADAEEIARLKADVEALVGALHQATIENHVLRQQQVDAGGMVRVLPTQPSTGPGR
ncbi:hypothetical protein ACFXIY_29150 [Streptomyces albidoflavus]